MSENRRRANNRERQRIIELIQVQTSLSGEGTNPSQYFIVQRCCRETPRVI
ncbi:MAG: hypothetical protein ACOX38_04270 [Bacillota bacterium]|nr:hypothetical protein [Bacillota bacterium]